jgi:predicted ATPase/class 3 adenylate cyclase
MPTSLVEKMQSAAPEILGERREVTVLFLDIVNYTTTAHSLDSEEVYLLTDEAMRLLAEVIYTYEGTIDKYTGDGLMALFGVPIAHENDPERAVRAALEMQIALQPLRQRIMEKHGVDLQTRIGVNTGLVIAGRIGSDLHVEYTVIGDTVNLADRLQGAAEPGTVAVSFATYQRTRPLFQYRSLPPETIKGRPHPVRMFRPFALRAKPGQVRGLPGLQVPMIGRQDGLARLHHALDVIHQDHHPRFVLVTGEAGLGKSRLVAEFRSSLVQPDVSIYQGNCLTYARSRPFWPLASMLRDMMQLSEIDEGSVQLEALRSYVAQVGLADDEIVPYLTNVLGLEHSDPRVQTRLHLIDALTLQQMTHAALRQVLLAEAHQAPSVLVFEDLHWVDPASRDFVEHLIETVDDIPVMLVLVSRDAERQTVIRPLVKAAEKHPDRLVDIQLQPLSEDEGALLVDQLLPQTTRRAQAIKRSIAERAEGNPFYAEEIIRMLIDQGGLRSKEESYEVTAQAEEILQEVPGTLVGLIQARLDRLPEPLRRTLQRAAVLGSTFPTGLLKKLSDMSAEQMSAHVSELESRQLLVPGSPASAETRAFAHTLIQEVAYNTLLRRDRQKLHGQVARALEEGTFWLPDEQTEALAQHYAESTQPSRAISYLISAAENAARRCANETAIQHYRRALDLMDSLGIEHGDELLRTQMGLGQALKFVGEYPDANRILKSALRHLLQPEVISVSESAIPLWVEGLRELADIQMREGSPGEAIAQLKAGLDVLGDDGAQAFPHLWRSLMDRLAWVRFRQGDLEEALALATSATTGADLEGVEDPMTVASLFNTLGGVSWQQGKLSEAITHVERSLNLYRPLGYLWGMANASSNLGILYYRRGDWPKALDEWQRTLELRQTMGDVQLQAATLINLGFLRTSMGEHELARRDLESALAMGQRLGDNWHIAHSRVGLAQLALVQSRFDIAEDDAQAALALSEGLGAGEIQVQARWILALTQAGRGRVESGLESGLHALDLARETGLVDLEADCLRVLGILQSRMGNWLEGETRFHESIELCLQQDDPYRQSLAHLEMGRMYQQLARAGDLAGAQWQAKAASTLEKAAAAFEQLGAAHDLQTAQELLRQVQVQTIMDSPATLPAGERRTAAIVWLGLSPPPGADEEAVFETIALVLPSLIAIAEEYQGQAVRRPDGLMVVFGAPVAFEDDSERAVQTAARMLRTLDELAQQSEVSLIRRIAVSEGNVVAGRIGPHFRADFAVRGDAVEAAQHLAESASPGRVWVTKPVRDSTERLFTYEAAPGTLLEQLAELNPSALVGMREQPRPARGLPGLVARFIGREAALQEMAALAAKLDQDMGGIVWIEGEPGIGKSRLMREFASSLSTVDVSAWEGSCSPQRSNYAFSLFSDLLGQALGLQPSATPAQIRHRLDLSVETWPGDARAMRPYLEVLLGVQPVGPDGQRLADLQPEQLRQQIFVALRRFFKSLSTGKPLVLILDDLHWVDPVSAELLFFLVTMVASVPILFVCAQRRQGADSPNDRLVRVQSLLPNQTVRLILERLTVVESDMLLSELLPGVDLPPDLRSVILERSEGNPYFTEEFVRMLIEEGHVQERGEAWELDPALELADFPLPTSLETLLRSRIDALPDDLKQVMQYAAVMGAPFEASLVESLPDLPAARAALARLESRLLVRRGAEGDQWHFHHSLIETVTYNTMLRARRRALHLKVAVALEARWAGAEAEHAEELARHFSQADEDAKALQYLILAGERAAARFANEEALTFLEQAAQRLTTQPDAEDDLRWRIAASLGDVHRAMGHYEDSKMALEIGLALVEEKALPDSLRVGALRRLGETLQKQGELDRADSHFGQALALLDRPEDREGQTEAARLLWGISWSHFVQGQLDQALYASESGLEYAQRAGALGELAMIENLLGGIYYLRNEWAKALTHTTRAMVLREQMGYTWGTASTLANLGILAIQSGQLNKGRSFFERSLALRQELGDVEGVATSHNNLGNLARDQGRLDVAESHFEECVAVARPLKMGFQIAHSTMGLAQIYLWKGEIAAAQEAVAASLAEATTIGAKDLLSEIHQVRSAILSATNDWDEAKQAAKRAISLAAETGNRSLQAAAWRAAAEVELQQDKLAPAREALARAQEALADGNEDLEAGRIAAQVGRVALAEGANAEAKAILQAAREIFARLEARRDLRQVEKALRRLPSPGTSTPPADAVA